VNFVCLNLFFGNKLAHVNEVTVKSTKHFNRNQQTVTDLGILYFQTSTSVLFSKKYNPGCLKTFTN